MGEPSGERLWGIQPRMRSGLSCTSSPVALIEWSIDDVKLGNAIYRCGQIRAVAIYESVSMVKKPPVMNRL